MSDLAMLLIARDEGLRLSAYQDSLGYWTIGYGHLVDSRLGGQIPRQIAEDLLELDILEAKSDLERTYPWFSALSETRQAVFLSLRFQLGHFGLLGFRKMLAFAAFGDFSSAASELTLSKLAQQAPERVSRLAAALRTDDPASFGL